MNRVENIHCHPSPSSRIMLATCVPRLGARTMPSVFTIRAHKYRSLHTQSKRIHGAAKSIGMPSAAALLVVGYCSLSAPLHAESSSSGRSRSSSVLREADPAAYRRPPTHLVFVSHEQDHKSEWQSWIGYFRQAGFDCVDMNLVLENDRRVESLSEELGGQIRLLSLPKPPLLFAYSGLGARAALAHIQSSAPTIGGLVLISPPNVKDSGLEQADSLDKDKLNILIHAKEDETAIRSTEQWMDKAGFS